MDPAPILPSNSDLERRRLESTIDNDLGSLSLSSLPTSTTTSHSFISSSSSTISMEYPRAETMSFAYQPHHHHGPTGTPRAAGRMSSRLSSFGAPEQSMFVGASPVSTAGHHASAVTLGAGVFGKRDEGNGNTSEFDPERSLGRLVGELGRVMGSDKLPSRPTSPFSPPRSPSPLPSLMQNNNQAANLSFTLNRNDPLLSPPSSGGEQTITQKNLPSNSNSRFSSLARELGEEIQNARKQKHRQQQQQQQPRRALSDSTTHNIQTPAPVSHMRKGDKGDRIKMLQGENRRSASAPIRSNKDDSMDVTGYTNLMATPAKGGEYGTLGKNGEVGGETGANIAGTLATLNARLRALETENSVSRRRVRELEDELEKARAEVEMAKRDGGKRLRDVIGEKSALEDLVQSLRSHLARLTVEVESNKALISELRSASSSSPPRRNIPPVPGSPSVKSELAALRREIERLTQEVARLGGIVEEGLETRKKARGERTMRMEREEMERLVRQVIDEENDAQKNVVEPSKLRQGLHTAASTSPTLAPPTVQPVRIAKSINRHHHLTPPPSEDDDELRSPTPVSRSNSRQGSLLDQQYPTQKSKMKSKSNKRVSHDTTAASAGGPSSPFPSILDDEQEAEFFSPSTRRTQTQTQIRTQDRAFVETQAEIRSKAPSRDSQRTASGSGTGSARRGLDGEELPPQTVLSRVVRELEDDFEHYKTIYSELADQYKLLDPASISSKRHVLAEHLREVIDVLERKADQIGDLYDLLEFKDKPLSDAQKKDGNGRWVGKSVGDVLRMVKSSLGEEVWRRLEGDLGHGHGRKKGGKEI